MSAPWKDITAIGWIKDVEDIDGSLSGLKIARVKVRLAISNDCVVRWGHLKSKIFDHASGISAIISKYTELK